MAYAIFFRARWRLVAHIAPRLAFAHLSQTYCKDQILFIFAEYSSEECRDAGDCVRRSPNQSHGRRAERPYTLSCHCRGTATSSDSTPTLSQFREKPIPLASSPLAPLAWERGRVEGFFTLSTLPQPLEAFCLRATTRRHRARPNQRSG